MLWVDEGWMEEDEFFFDLAYSYTIHSLFKMIYPMFYENRERR